MNENLVVGKCKLAEFCRRNRLIHGYFDVNLDIVWQTVTENLPDLVVKLEEITP